MPLFGKKARPIRPSMTEKNPPEYVPVRRKVRIEIERPKLDETTQKWKTVIISRVKTVRNKSVFFIKHPKGNQPPIGGHWVDFSCLTKDGKLRYDAQYSEPIDPETGRPGRSSELSFAMANSYAEQMIKVGTIIAGFILQPQHLTVMLIAALIGGFGVYSLNPIFHFTPTVAVHWLPTPPKVVP